MRTTNPISTLTAASRFDFRQSRFDAETVRGPTGRIHRGASMLENKKEAFFDKLGAVPLLGGALNAQRGLFKIAKGALTGNPAEVQRGMRSLKKGAMYAVPGLGTAAAAASATKNDADAMRHGVVGLVQGRSALESAGYGAGLAYRG